MFYLPGLLQLFVIRTLFGQFSEEYFTRSKAFRRRYPDYKGKVRSCFKEEAILHLDRVLRMNPAVPVHPTKEIIQFENFAFGVSPKAVTGKKGPPACMKFEKYKGDTWEILGYNERLDKKSMKEYFFFRKDMLFFGEYILDTSAQSQPSDLGNLREKALSREFADSFTQAILERYKVDTPAGSQVFYIRDSQDHLLYFQNDDGRIFLRYFNNLSQDIKDLLGKSFPIYQNSDVVRETIFDKL